MKLAPVQGPASSLASRRAGGPQPSHQAGLVWGVGMEQRFATVGCTGLVHQVFMQSLSQLVFTDHRS